MSFSDTGERTSSKIQIVKLPYRYISKKYYLAVTMTSYFTDSVPFHIDKHVRVSERTTDNFWILPSEVRCNSIMVCCPRNNVVIEFAPLKKECKITIDRVSIVVYTCKSKENEKLYPLVSLQFVVAYRKICIYVYNIMAAVKITRMDKYSV